MEHFFRTTLWIFVLIGCLQAAPTPYMEDFRFDLLREVTCNGNVTFKSPKTPSGSCCTALETIREGLEKADNSCQCSYCNDTLDALEMFKVPSAVANSPKCSGEREALLTFDKFVEEFESVIQIINN